MDEISELALLSDTECKSLCKLMRRPGGLIPNPNAAGAGQPPMINTPGHTVSMRAVTNLKPACFFIRHHIRTSRTCSAATVLLPDVRTLRDLKSLEEAYAVPDSPPTINEHNWPKTLEGIVLWVAKHLGAKKTPLQYIIQNKQTPPLEINDPAFGAVGTEYLSHQEEMTVRGPFFTTGTTVSAIFTTDNNKVWDILQKLCKEHTC